VRAFMQRAEAVGAGCRPGLKRQRRADLCDRIAPTEPACAGPLSRGRTT
jgi:hypothetical protein